MARAFQPINTVTDSCLRIVRETTKTDHIVQNARDVNAKFGGPFSGNHLLTNTGHPGS